MVGRADAEAELRSAREVARDIGLDVRTFVYPRNLVGHPDVLTAQGFTGYRLRPESGLGRMGRIGNLVSEFNLLAAVQDRPRRAGGGPVPIPSGRFLNWRNGPRRLIPPALTVSRWSRILRDAARNGRVAHIFLHPHNLIDGPGTGEALDAILAEAARLRDRGLLRIVTQAEYCAMMGEPGSAESGRVLGQMHSA